jgi:hypothetical protein
MNTATGADIFLNLIFCMALFTVIWFGLAMATMHISFLFGVAGFKAHSSLKAC